MLKTFVRRLAAVLTAALICLNLFYELAPGYIVGPETKLAFAAGFAVLLGVSLFYGVPKSARGTRRHDYMMLLFWYYLWVLANVLFFDNAFGRGFHLGVDYIDYGAVNLEPLRTVKNYLIAYGYNNISLRLVVLNLLGNLAAFAPNGRVPARAVPLAAQHFLFHRHAHARHHRGRGCAGVHRCRLVRCGRPDFEPRRGARGVPHLPHHTALEVHLPGQSAQLNGKEASRCQTACLPSCSIWGRADTA